MELRTLYDFREEVRIEAQAAGYPTNPWNTTILSKIERIAKDNYFNYVSAIAWEEGFKAGANKETITNPYKL